MLTWIAPLPAVASVFSHELIGVPDLPTTPTEKAARALYPGPVQWIFGAPETDDGTFVGFLKRVRGFFAAESPASRRVVSAIVEADRDIPSENASHRDWDTPLPVAENTSGDIERKDVFEIFLGVNLQYFLSRLFSAVLNVNEDILTDRREREREDWREIFFGGGAGSISYRSSSTGNAPNGRYHHWSYDAWATTADGRRTYFPFEDENRKFDDKNAFVQVRERVIEFFSHPLFLIGLVIAALCGLVRKMYGEVAAG